MGNQESGQACGSGILTINLAALRHNYRALQAWAGGAQAAGVVKADAYGLGADIIAPALYEAGCRLFFVAQLAEALRLRAIPAVGSDAEIAILNDVLPQEIAPAARADVIPVIDSLDSLRLWAEQAARLGRKLPAMLQADSGMARLGLDEAELAELCAAPELLKNIEVKALLSHLACADEAASPMNAAQRARFLHNAARLEKAIGRRVPLSLSASCGAALGGDFCLDIIRPGIALYGVVDSTDDKGAAEGEGRLAAALRPVVSLQGRVLRVSRLRQGETVGYGAAYTAAQAMPAVTVSIGYGDGWPRALSNKGAVYYQGIRLPIIGRISMDCLVADLSPAAQAGIALPQRGDLIEFIGSHQSLAAVARDAGMIPYELLTSLGRRYIKRVAGK